MTQNPLISIVVPVYKVERFLDRCVESVLGQSYPHWELILVDDGSPDRCPQLCDGWAERDGRIRVLHKENGGLSDARNRGVELATGDYISFVDSDDYIAPDYLEYLLGLLREHDADIAAGSFRTVPDGEERFANQPQERMLRLNAEEAGLTLMGPEYNVQLVVAWGKLYEAELVRRNPFPVGRLHEDEATTYKYYDQCRALAVGTREIYGYYQNPQSITHTKTRKNRKAVLLAFEEQCAYYAARGEETLRRAAAKRLVCNLVDMAERGDELSREYLRENRARPYLPLLDGKSRIKYYGYRALGVDLSKPYHRLLGR